MPSKIDRLRESSRSAPDAGGRRGVHYLKVHQDNSDTPGAITFGKEPAFDLPPNLKLVLDLDNSKRGAQLVEGAEVHSKKWFDIYEPLTMNEIEKFDKEGNRGDWRYAYSLRFRALDGSVELQLDGAQQWLATMVGDENNGMLKHVFEAAKKNPDDYEAGKCNPVFTLHKDKYLLKKFNKWIHRATATFEGFSELPEIKGADDDGSAPRPADDEPKKAEQPKEEPKEPADENDSGRRREREIID